MPGRTFSPNLSKFITFAAPPLGSTPFARGQGVSDLAPGVDSALARGISELTGLQGGGISAITQTFLDLVNTNYIFERFMGGELLFLLFSY